MTASTPPRRIAHPTGIVRHVQNSIGLYRDRYRKTRYPAVTFRRMFWLTREGVTLTAAHIVRHALGMDAAPAASPSEPVEDTATARLSDQGNWQRAIEVQNQVAALRVTLADALLDLPPSYRRILQSKLADLADLVDPNTPDYLCALLLAPGQGEDEATPATAEPGPSPIAPAARTPAAADIIPRALAPHAADEAEGGAA